jgi:hypothetical protein
MNWANPDKAWETLVSRKADRKENRPAFIAALLMERCNNALPKGGDVNPLTPHMAEAVTVELVRLAGSIKALAEADCNYGLTDRQESRMVKLQERFRDIAEALGFEARTGGDPRGACAYLIDPNDRKGDGWGEGWAVYK